MYKINWLRQNVKFQSLEKQNKTAKCKYCIYLSLWKSYFSVKQEDAYSDLRKIQVGVSQGSVLGPVLYLLSNSDVPNFEQYVVATFADDSSVMPKRQQ